MHSSHASFSRILLKRSTATALLFACRASLPRGRICLHVSGLDSADCDFPFPLPTKQDIATCYSDELDAARLARWYRNVALRPISYNNDCRMKIKKCQGNQEMSGINQEVSGSNQDAFSS